MKTALKTLSSIVLAMFVNNVNAAQSKIIYAGSLLVAPEQALKKEQTLVVTNDKITAIKDGYVSKSVLNLPDAEIVNLKNQFVMPGLIDMHVHLDCSFLSVSCDELLFPLHIGHVLFVDQC